MKCNLVLALTDSLCQEVIQHLKDAGWSIDPGYEEYNNLLVRLYTDEVIYNPATPEDLDWYRIDSTGDIKKISRQAAQELLVPYDYE